MSDETEEMAAVPGIYYGYFIVLASFIIVLVAWGTFLSFGVFLEPLAKHFGWGRAETSGSYAIANLVAGFVAILMGRWNDTLGPKKVVSLCALTVGVGYLLTATVQTLWQLYLFYGAVLGFGLAGLFVPVTSTVARWFVKERTLMTGMVLLGTSVGTMVVPKLTARLISSFGWRPTFAIVGAINLVAILAAAQVLRSNPEHLSKDRDGKDREGVSGLQNCGFSVGEALYMKQFWLLCGIYFCFFFSINAVVAHLVVHAAGMGVSLERAANIMLAVGVGGIIARFIVGHGGDKIGNRKVCLICFVFMGLTTLSLIKASDLLGLSLGALAIGFCFAGSGSLMAPLTADYFGLKAHGVILGIVYASDMVGGAIGPVMAGAIFDVTKSYDWAFLSASLIAFLGCIMLVLLGERREW